MNLSYFRICVLEFRRLFPQQANPYRYRSWVRSPPPLPKIRKIHVDSAALTHQPPLDLCSQRQGFAPILRPSRGGPVKILRRNDRASVDRGELRLIRIGHALGAMMKRDRARNGGYLPQSDPIWEALATIWKLKREYRAKLVARRQTESAELRAKFAKAQVGT